MGVLIKLSIMRPGKAMDLIKPMLTKPSFTAKEARGLGVHPALLNYYVKTGELEQVRRGVYRHPGAPESSEIQWADLVNSVLSIPGGAICLISALAVYDLTEEIPRHHWIAVSHDTSAKAQYPIKIVRYRNADLGKTQIEIGGVQVQIYDRERTIIDAFRRLSRETAIKALKFALKKGGKEKIDLVKLQKYAKKLRTPIEPYLLAVTT